MVTMRARRHALQEADALLRDLDVPQDKPIDVLSLIAQLDLDLVFNDLRTILGALIPQGDGGIMLSTQRSASVQRYTAAHELGHWVLDHEVAFDTEAELYTPTHDREQLAQVFASQLLMPPPLVHATAANHGVTGSANATGSLVYLMARDMGASYEAVVRQLDNLDVINRSKRDELLSLRPQSIKTELSLGHRPVGPVDVWPVDVRLSGQTITVTEGDEVIVVLPESRTTGFQWLTEKELQARANRVLGPPPVMPANAVTPLPDPGRLARVGEHSQPHRADSRALLDIPGNRGAGRIWRGTDSPSDDLAADGDVVERSLLDEDPELQTVDDRYRPSWASVRASDLRELRRAIAEGRPLAAATDVALNGDVDEPPVASELLAGGTGTRVIALRSAGVGVESYELMYASAYDPSAESAETYRIDVAIVSSPAVAQRKHLVEVARLDDLNRDEALQDLEDGE